MDILPDHPISPVEYHGPHPLENPVYEEREIAERGYEILEPGDCGVPRNEFTSPGHTGSPRNHTPRKGDTGVRGESGHIHRYLGDGGSRGNEGHRSRNQHQGESGDDRTPVPELVITVETPPFQRSRASQDEIDMRKVGQHPLAQLPVTRPDPDTMQRLIGDGENEADNVRSTPRSRVSMTSRSSLNSTSLDMYYDRMSDTGSAGSGPNDNALTHNSLTRTYSEGAGPSRPFQKEVAKRMLSRTYSAGKSGAGDLEAPVIREVDENKSGYDPSVDTDLGEEEEEEGKEEKEEEEEEEICYCCIAKHHPLPDDAPRLQRLHYFFMCPPHGRLVKSATLVLIGFFFWATFWAILGNQALPGGNFFGIAYVWVMSATFGFIAENIGLPRLLGTLVGGLLSSNIPVIDFGRDIDKEWSTGLRKMAIVIVLIRAGLGVDLRALWRHKYVVARMGSVPMVTEGVAVAIASHYLLLMPWRWAFLTGYTIAPMSAAACIPFMIGFQNAGIGVDKGVPSIVKLGAVFDNILGLCLFSTFVGVVFQKGDLLLAVLRLFPLQIVVGLAGGFIVGFGLWYIPHNNSKHKLLYRFIFLLAGCIVGAFASGLAHFSSAGPLANVVIAIVAGYKWKKQGWTRTTNPLIPIFSLIWIGSQIMLSGLIGALVDIRNTNWATVGIGLGVLLIGMSCRLMAQFIMAHNSHLNMKERVFVTIAWLPKATIQAAAGSIAVDRAIANKLPKEDLDRGHTIFTLAVMAIGLWASVGALAIVNSGPRLLKKSPPKKKISRIRTDVKDAAVQTGLSASTRDDDRPRSSVASFYGNYPRLHSTSSELEHDPITIEMRHLVHGYL